MLEAKRIAFKTRVAGWQGWVQWVPCIVSGAQVVPCIFNTRCDPSKLFHIFSCCSCAGSDCIVSKACLARRFLKLCWKLNLLVPLNTDLNLICSWCTHFNIFPPISGRLRWLSASWAGEVHMSCARWDSAIGFFKTLLAMGNRLEMNRRSKGPCRDCPLQRPPRFQHETPRKFFLSSRMFFLRKI